MPKMCYFY